MIIEKNNLKNSTAQTVLSIKEFATVHTSFTLYPLIMIIYFDQWKVTCGTAVTCSDKNRKSD